MTSWSASVAYSHLFPGARLELDSGPAQPGSLRLRFSDGVEVVAELVAVGPDQQLLLSVPGFTTGAGAGVEARVWTIRPPRQDQPDTLILGSRTGLRQS